MTTTTQEPTVNEQDSDIAAPTTFEVPAFLYEEFVKRVDAANRRLARAGGTESFTFDHETFERPERKFDQAKYAWVETGVFLPYFRATLTSEFRIAVAEHTFVASLVAEEAGYTVHTAPGQSLDGWTRPNVDDIHCDVCNTVRRRQNIYIVREDATGALIQVGSNCIAPLLGFSPQSLWALTWTESLTELTETEAIEEDWAGYRGRAERTVAISHVLAIAWAVTSGGVNYTSTKAADAYYATSGGRAALATTVSKIRAHLAGRPRPWKGDDSQGIAWDSVQALVEAVTPEQVAAVIAVADTLKPGTDYADNLHTILAAESGRVTFRNIGILGSLLAVYAREQGNAAERELKAAADPIAKGWVGSVKERVRNLAVTITTIKKFQRDSFSGYGTETATMVIARTADNHVIKWVYAGSYGYEAGDALTITGTVKKQDTWNDIDQTVLTRVVIHDDSKEGQ